MPLTSMTMLIVYRVLRDIIYQQSDIAHLHILVKHNQNEQNLALFPESAHFGRICHQPPLHNKNNITKGGLSNNLNDQTQKKVIDKKVSNTVHASVSDSFFLTYIMFDNFTYYCID